MGIIYGDSAEPAKIHKLFKKRIGEQYQIKQLGFPVCSKNKVSLCKDFLFVCVEEYEVNEILKCGFKHCSGKNKCALCDDNNFTRVADFSNDKGSFYIERKSVSDFLSSMKDRLYNQMNKMDTFVSGNKIIILEGTPREKDVSMFYDSNKFFSGIDKKRHDLRGLSPIEQAIILSGRKEWVWSFIREAFMRGIMFVQTWDMKETVEFVIQADEGFDKVSKHRVIPKKYPELPLNQAIMSLFNGIGLKKSLSVLNKDLKLKKRLNGIINYINKTHATHKKVR